MRSNALLFVHLLAAFALVGGSIVVAVASVAARRHRAEHETALLKGTGWRALAYLTLPAAVVTIAAGEGLRSKEGARGTWLDVAYPASYLGILGVGLVLAFVSRRALDRPGASRAAPVLGGVVLAACAVTIFVMVGKPGV